MSANCRDQNVPVDKICEGKQRNFKTVQMGVELCHEDRRSWNEQQRKETRRDEEQREREREREREMNPQG